MTIEQQIAYWRKAASDAPTKEAALVAFGVVVGLTHAKENEMNTAEQLAGLIMDADIPARLTAENATLTKTVGRLQDVISAILAEPHGCVFCDSGKLRNPAKDHDPKCGFAMAEACFPRPA